MFKKKDKEKQEMKKPKRVLTEAELRRKEEFEKIKEQYLEKGYVEKDLTVSVVYANVMAMIIGLPVVMVMCVLYVLLNGKFTIEVSVGGELIFLIALFVAIVVHELIHGISWAIFSKNHFKDIEFGFIAQYLTPYCCCKATLQKYQYVIGAIMPTIILGILPCVIAAFISSGGVFAFGVVMIFSGGGDMTIILKMLSYKSEKKEKLYMDHPYECGMVVFEK